MRVYGNDLKRTGCNSCVQSGGAFIRAITWTLLVLTCSILVVGFPSTGCGTEDPLTPEERAWLKQYDGKIIVNKEAGWPPIIDTDNNGNSFGIVMDYQKLIEKKLKFRFKIDQLDSWKNFMERFRKGEIDVNNNLQKTPQRMEYALFTKPYIEIPNAIIVRKETKNALTLEKMREMKIAVSNDFAIHQYIKNTYDYLQLIPLDDDLDCLLATSTKNVDAAVVNLAVASFIIEKMGIANLRVAGYAEYTNALCFASRKDWPILNRILDKGLNLITQTERDAIYRKWISLRYVPFYKNHNFWIVTCSVAVVIVALILIILVWNRSLKRQVELRTKKLESINVQLENGIVERKRTEEALRESEERYRVITENMSDTVWLMDTNFKTTYISPSLTRKRGYTLEELQALSLQQNFSPASMQIVAQVVEEELTPERLAQKDLKIERTLELEVCRKDGSLFWNEITMTLIRDQQGRPAGFVGVGRDITERKSAEKEKTKLELQLIQAQKMESIGSLAGGIAHDFNNILSSIIGFTELALDDVETGTPIEGNLQEVYTAGKRAKDLVKQILAFARQSDEEFKPICPSMIVKEVMKLIRSSIPTSIDIRQDIKSDSLVMGNTTQIHQVLMNLCTNAAYAMEPEGGVLCINLKDVMINRGAETIKPGNYIEIEVSDTGVGMAPDVLDKIFDPYFTTKGPGEGTGMGLAMVHGIIKSSGGEIMVNSKQGQGTRFTIYLPVISKRQHLSQSETETSPKGKERILFVDDEASIARMGSQVFERLGYSVTTRTSSVEALELFRSRPNDFDLLVTDMTMPNMTGDQLAVELIKIRSDIPVILCTGYSKKISDEKAADLGIKAFIYKPIIKAELAKTVRKVLDDAKT